jgi:hypothetical protein
MVWLGMHRRLCRWARTLGAWACSGPARLEELKKGISDRKLPLRIQELTKRSVKQLSRFQSRIHQIFPNFILFLFSPRIRVRTVYAAHSAGQYGIFSFPFQAAAVTVIATTALLLS